MRSRYVRCDLDAGELSRLEVRRDLLRRGSQRVDAAHLGADRRDAETAVRRVGREREQLLAGPRRTRHVLAEAVRERERVRGRRHLAEVELRDVPDVLEDAREIVQEAVDLVIREADAGEVGGVQHVVSVESHRLGE